MGRWIALSLSLCLLLAFGADASAGMATAVGTAAAAAEPDERLSFEALDVEMEFVDAQGETTGYYVDVSQAQYVNTDEVAAWVEVVRADDNRLYLYRARFNRGRQTYVIERTIIAEYDSKRILQRSERRLEPAPCKPGSPMDNVAAYLFEHCPSEIKSKLPPPSPPPMPTAKPGATKAAKQPPAKP